MKTVLSFRSVLRRVVLQRRAGDQEEKVFPVKDMEVEGGGKLRVCLTEVRWYFAVTRTCTIKGLENSQSIC